ncbi:MAG: Cna B-type domain-containing protein, partial [Clostridia bacterium]|nr:Cna B-type domain-containing protein [Clostridia bacterium]
MTFKRFIAVALAVLLLLGALPEILPEALAAPSEDGCPKSSSGKHSWYSRPRSAWCDYAGGNVWICSFCNKTVFEETTPALGHDWPAWTVTKTATCTEKGSRTRTCNRCHKVETQELAVLGHYFPNPWKTVKEPACEEAGQEVNYCTRCGYEWRRELEAIGHDWDEGVVTKKPTAYEEGEKTYTCKNDSSHTKTEPIPATEGFTSQTVKIVWDDNNDEAGLRPSTVAMEMTPSTSWSVYESTVVNLSVSNSWTYTISDLPVKDKEGIKLDYAWTEHTDDLPSSYKLINTEETEEGTVFTNWYDNSADRSPSLKLSVAGDYKLRRYDVDNFSGADVDIGIDALIDIQLTNTGNMPLYTKGCMRYDELETKSIWQYTGHDSSDLVLTTGKTYEDKNSFNLRHSNDYYGSNIDHTTETPDDPDYEAKVSITFWYYGYDPAEVMANSGLDGIEPLCQSNACTFTVYIPREKAEALPTLDAVKSVAHLPKDGEYFHEGEQIDWSLTVTNTG